MLTDKRYEDYFAALLRGDTERCLATVEELLDSGVEIKVLYTDWFQRSLYQVGDLWELGRLSVAVEHLATAITERMLQLVYPRLFRGERAAGTRYVVISCAANELHQIGGQIVADMFALHGWHSTFIGANTPVDVLIELVERQQPDLVGLSLAVDFNLPGLLSALERLDRRFPDLKVIVGGQAFRRGGSGYLGDFPRVRLITDLDALEAVIAGF